MFIGIRERKSSTVCNGNTRRELHQSKTVEPPRHKGAKKSGSTCRLNTTDTATKKTVKDNWNMENASN